MHEGHRSRILMRAWEDVAGLADHELLEILLFNCIPRKNTNPLAHELLYAFGSLKAVLEAPAERLSEIPGVGRQTAAYLRCVGELLHRTDTDPEAEYVVDLGRYSEAIRKRYRGVTEELLEVCCLDRKGKIIQRTRFTTHEEDKVSVTAEKVNRVIATIDPKGILIVHNHPKGSSEPSEADDEFTDRIQLLCAVNGVLFYDHIIIARDDFYSYFRAGRMEGIRSKFDIDSLVTKS